MSVTTSELIEACADERVGGEYMSVMVDDSLMDRVDAYENTATHNDSLHEEFTRLTQSIPFIARHRKHVEANQLGFGDAAFHYMWYLLIKHMAQNFMRPNCLEIGVFKGQVISLWALIAAELGYDMSITGISPFKGNPLPVSKWKRRLKRLSSAAFRQELAAGNFYPDEDYKLVVKSLFQAFDLSLSQTQFIEGYSNDAAVLDVARRQKYTLIYIDGDHTYEGATADIKDYSPLIEEGGFLVMDDASCNLPGNSFWKGHESVSRACEIIPTLGFKNILNVGHNRVYRRGK
jgi:Methyltransferase domain